MSAPVVALEDLDLVFTDLKARLASCAAYVSTLSRSERERAGRYQFDADRRRFIVARGHLREALASRLGTSAAAVPITELSGGKPVIAGETGLWFSVSRSAELAVLAFSPVEIGIDLVSLRAGRFIAALAGDICSSAERAAIAALGPDARTRALLTLWARKEALLKATGEGLVRTPDWLEAWNGSHVSDLCIQHGGRRWRLRDCGAPDGHIVSVAQATG